MQETPFSIADADITDDAVWASLVERAGPASLLVVIHARMGELLRSRFSPEDVLQDSLLLAWRDRASFEWKGLRAFRQYLLQVIDHRLHDLADQEAALKRGGGAAPQRLQISGADVPAALLQSTTAGRMAIYKEQASHIRAALSDVSAEFREIVHLRLLEHMTTEQISHRLDLGHAAVRYRLRRGSQEFSLALRARLGE